MTSRKILGEEPMSMVSVKEVLESIRARDGELSFRAGKTEEYLQNFAKLDSDRAKKLVKKLNDLDIPRMKDSHVIKLIDLLPTTPNDVKFVLQGYPITVSSDSCKKIAEVIAEFVEKESKKKEKAATEEE